VPSFADPIGAATVRERFAHRPRKPRCTLELRARLLGRSGNHGEFDTWSPGTEINSENRSSCRILKHHSALQKAIREYLNIWSYALISNTAIFTGLKTFCLQALILLNRTERRINKRRVRLGYCFLIIIWAKRPWPAGFYA